MHSEGRHVTTGIGGSVIENAHPIGPEREAASGIAAGRIVGGQHVALAAAPGSARGAFLRKGKIAQWTGDDEDGEIVGRHETIRAEEIIQPIKPNAGESVENVLEDLGPKGLDRLGDMPAAAREILPPDHPPAGIHLHPRTGHEPEDGRKPNGGRWG
jgi:hypothetical protein